MIQLPLDGGPAQGQATGGDELCEGLPAYEFHHDRSIVVDMDDVVDGGDMRMIQRRQCPRFALEAGDNLWPIVVRERQHFQRNLAPEACIAGAIDLSHTTGAKRIQDLVGPKA